MEVFEFVSDLLALFSSTSGREEKWRKRLSKFLRTLLLVTGIIWFSYELLRMLQLERPFLFLGVALAISCTCAVLLLLALFFTRMIATYQPKNFVMLVVGLSLLLTAAMGCLNRNNGYLLMGSKVVQKAETGNK